VRGPACRLIGGQNGHHNSSAHYRFSVACRRRLVRPRTLVLGSWRKSRSLAWRPHEVRAAANLHSLVCAFRQVDTHIKNGEQVENPKPKQHDDECCNNGDELPHNRYGTPIKNGHSWLPKPNVTTANQITVAVTATTAMRIHSHIYKTLAR
jgi:hypothetical protein